MKYVFGPVPSRRLGQSLGIDPIPLKTCNWNCVYCQLGRTVPLTSVRRVYVPPQDILSEVKQVLVTPSSGRLDWITFVGSGEPTLHSRLGDVIRGVKRITGIPVAVITNGAVVPECGRRSPYDAVLPHWIPTRNCTLINPALSHVRAPCGRVGGVRKHFLEDCGGGHAMRGLNDGEQALREIAAVRRIRPDEVRQYQPPPPRHGEYPEEEALTRGLAILGQVARVVHPAEGSFERGLQEDLVEAVVSIITRHPVRHDELVHMLTRWAPGDIDQALTALEQSGKAQTVARYGHLFWTAAPSHFPAEGSSERTNPDARGRAAVSSNHRTLNRGGIISARNPNIGINHL
jgi:wyosine [tRNA(Phe)-imidazoG37] synthetase (radical SAM superfamily)